jgi:hypothetical protein
MKLVRLIEMCFTETYRKVCIGKHLSDAVPPIQNGLKQEKFKYLAMMVTNQNCIHEEIKSSLSLGKAGYHAVQNLLASWLLSKSVQCKIYKKL